MKEKGRVSDGIITDPRRAARPMVDTDLTEISVLIREAEAERPHTIGALARAWCERKPAIDASSGAAA
jgi:hypothetical protein